MIAPRGTTRLDTRFPNYAKVLGAHGYLTAHYGKWHLGAAPYSPREHGFDVDVPNSPRMAPKGVTSAPKNTVKALAYKPVSIWKTAWPMKPFALFTSTKTAPFTQLLGLFCPFTWFAKEALLQKYRAAQTLPADAAQRNPIYAGMVETFDTNVGRLLDALERLRNC